MGKSECEQKAWKTKDKRTPKNTRIDGENKRAKLRKATIYGVVHDTKAQRRCPRKTSYLLGQFFGRQIL